MWKLDWFQDPPDDWIKEKKNWKQKWELELCHILSFMTFLLSFPCRKITIMSFCSIINVGIYLHHWMLAAAISHHCIFVRWRRESSLPDKTLKETSLRIRRLKWKLLVMLLCSNISKFKKNRSSFTNGSNLFLWTNDFSRKFELG